MIHVLIDTLVFGSLLAIVALGVNLVYGLLGFANFAHVELVTVGAFLTWACNRAGVPLVPAAALSAAGVGLLAAASHLAIFQWLDQRPAASKMIASVGLAIVLRASVPLAFGGDAHQLGPEPEVLTTIGGTAVNALEVAIFVVALVLMVVLHLALTRTRFGTAIRATAQNQSLAGTRGINGRRVVLCVWGIAGAFAAVAGTLIAMQDQVRPSMGLALIIPVFAAATVGGLGSAYGAVAGAFFIALVQNVGLAIEIGGAQVPTDYKDLIALMALIVVLLLKPTGLARSSTA